MDDKHATRIVRIVASVTRRSPDAIRADATFDEQGIDSLDRINILFELESKFDVNIPDEEARDITSINQIIERLYTHLEHAEGKGALVAMPRVAITGLLVVEADRKSRYPGLLEYVRLARRTVVGHDRPLGFAATRLGTGPARRRTIESKSSQKTAPFFGVPCTLNTLEPIS